MTLINYFVTSVSHPSVSDREETFLCAVKMQKLLIFVFPLTLHVVVGPFYYGRAPFSENEMSELNGRMTPRQVR